MCARYGWTLHYIYSLPYQWFLDQLDVLKEALIREYKEDLSLQAFNAWQITEVLKAIVSGDKHKAMNFGKYIDKMGLTKNDNEPTQNEEALKRLEKATIQQEKEKALKVASDIVEQFRKGRNIKND
jgi:hypothetical protein